MEIRGAHAHRRSIGGALTKALDIVDAVTSHLPWSRLLLVAVPALMKR